MSVDDSGANRLLPDEYFERIARPRPHPAPPQVAEAGVTSLWRTIRSPFSYLRARKALGAPLPMAAAVAPPGGIPREFVDALRGHHDIADVTLGTTQVRVALTAGRRHQPDKEQEIRVWAGIVHVFRDTALRVRREAAHPAGHPIRHCAASVADAHATGQPMMPSGIDALTWQQDGRAVYAARPGCPRRTLKRLRAARQPRRLAALET